MRPHEVANRIPASALFITSGISLYLGAALAVTLFAFAPPLTVAWARGMTAGLLLLLIIRPWRYTWTRKTFLESSLFGIVLLAMNIAFYIAIAYLPLGAAVALEFVGPIIVAARGLRGPRGKVAVALAAIGVALISLIGLDWDGVGVRELTIGLIAIACASALWSGYMVLAGKIVTERSGQASLAVGAIVGPLVFMPIALPWAGGLFTWQGVGIAFGLGVLSSVLPYMIDQVTIRRLGTSTFALLNALLPATATLIGLIGLRQIPTWGELGGLLAITIAVAISTRAAEPLPSPQSLGSEEIS